MERPKRQSTVDKDYREHKRSKKGETASSPVKEESLSPFEQLYRDVVNYRDPEDEDYDITAIFMKLPSKKEYPDYYQIIKQPIALETIKNKIDKNMYQSISQMKADIDLMVSNAKKYNMKGSQIYEDAIKIQRYVKGWQGVKEKAVLKLPGEAFNSAPKIKAIKLKAIDKPKKSSTNTKALMTAIIKREVKRALELLDTDPQIDPNELVPAEMFNDKFTWGPLHAACYYGDIKLVEALIAKGAEVEKQDTWHSATPLGWAAFGDKHNVVRLLLQKYNANKNAKNVHGQVPFELVSNQDDPRWIGLFKDTPSAQQQQQQQPQTQQEQQPQPQQMKQELPSQPSQPPPSVPLLQQAMPPPLPQQQSVQLPMMTNTMPMVSVPQPIKAFPTIPGVRQPVYQTSPDGTIRKRRGRPPKSETDALAVRPTTEIDINTFDPVAFEIELFNAIRTHTDNSNRLYSELFEDLPDRHEYPEYYSVIKNPRSLSEVAEKMQTRSYPNLYAWMSDMKLVFENALKFNEPGSRIFRDAKLLLRLLHRLKERILARLGVPVSQEDAIMRLDLASRPFDAEALSEDKRKIKRFLTSSKSRTQSIEPDHHHLTYQQQATATPMIHPLLLQQQQPQAQPSFLQHPPPFLMQPSLQSLPMMTPNAFMPPPQPPMMEQHNIELPKSPLTKASKEFYAVFAEGVGSFLNELTVSSKDFSQRLTGDYFGHSIVVPPGTQTLDIQTDLPKPLKNEDKRITITVLQNNVKLNPTAGLSWTTVPLTKGMNVIKINVTANLSQPDSTVPEFKSQVYHLFITQ